MAKPREHVVLVTNRTDKVGGLERYVSELATRLDTMGFRVTVVCKRTSTTENVTGAAGFQVQTTWAPSKRNPLFGLLYGLGVPIATTRALNRLRSGAIIHGHFFAPMLTEAIRGSDYFFTLHGAVHREILDEAGDSYFLPEVAKTLAVKAVAGAERKVVGQARLTTVLSQYMLSEAADLGANPARVRVLSGGVDTDFFKPGPAQLPDWAKTHGPVILSTRRLVAGKGVLELVRAMPSVIAEFPNALLVVAGDGSERAAIEKFVLESGLKHHVRLLGNIGGTELRNWYRRAHLAITPTQRPEPFGLSTVEALSCGTPVMVTPVGANSELVSGLHPALVSSGPSAVHMASAIQTLLRTPELLRDISSRARQHVHPRLSWNFVAREWADLYREEFSRRERIAPGSAQTL